MHTSDAHSMSLLIGTMPKTLKHTNAFRNPHIKGICHYLAAFHPQSAHISPGRRIRYMTRHLLIKYRILYFLETIDLVFNYAHCSARLQDVKNSWLVKRSRIFGHKVVAVILTFEQNIQRNPRILLANPMPKVEHCRGKPPTG